MQNSAKLDCMTVTVDRTDKRGVVRGGEQQMNVYNGNNICKKGSIVKYIYISVLCKTKL